MPQRDSVVLVDPVLNGAPFKMACADRGLDVVGVYTIDRPVVTAMDPDHAAGDVRSVYAREPDVPTRPAAVVPATEPGVLVAARLAGGFGLPGQPAAVAPALRDKRRMRRHARARGIRVPRFTTAAVGLAEALHHTGLPAIVKPTSGAGSHNVFLVREPNDLDRIARADRHDLFGDAIDEWLVEEYVRGREFAVNTFTVDGGHTVLDVWEYRQPGPGDYDNPYWDFVQVGPDTPGRATVAWFAQRVLDAFEIALGPAHVEIKLPTDGDPVLIELGARLPGAGIPSQWERHSALRPYADTLAVHLGESPTTLEPGFDARLGMCFVRHDGPAGVLRAVHGLDTVPTWTGVEGVAAAAPGSPIGTTTALGAEVARVQLAAPDDATLASLIARVRAEIRVEVVDRPARAA
ncbi:ATP-grasp domain-containing protein [Pseudonocardia kongjuensis]|uniref:ATP-grasp domain-containing protein n=1 Tax=Pseudonocardia kongjuensis TaxID=102227 RepID=A0ABN1XXA2_9PSEU